MKVIKGDLIKMAKDGKFNVIIHGANCQHVMGGGDWGIISKIIDYELEGLNHTLVEYDK